MIPLRLLGGVFATSKLEEEERVDINRIKSALYTAFVMDGFVVYE